MIQKRNHIIMGAERIGMEVDVDVVSWRAQKVRRAFNTRTSLGIGARIGGIIHPCHRGLAALSMVMQYVASMPVAEAGLCNMIA